MTPSSKTPVSLSNNQAVMTLPDSVPEGGPHLELWIVKLAPFW